MNTKTTIKSVFSDAGKIAAKAIAYFILTIIAFGIVNTLLFSVGLYYYKSIDYADKNVWFMVAVVTIGVFLLILSLVTLYKYLIVEAIHKAYIHLRPFFRKLCAKFVEKDSVAGGINKAVNINDMLTEMYGRSVPSIVRKGIGFVIKLIPFASILFDAKEIVKNGSNQEIEDAMFIEVDTYITHEIFNKNSVKSMFVFWMVNLILHIGIVFAMIHFFKSWAGIL